MLGLFVPNGPYRRISRGIDLSAFLRVFAHRKFRGAALGYFGHMWELYAFWAFVPVYIMMYAQDSQMSLSVSFYTFLTIAIGGIGCVIGGYFSLRIGSEKVAGRSLFTSLLCVLFSPFALWLPEVLFVPFLLTWGIAVIVDSPQFSSSAASHSPLALTGTALTIMNSIGFAITIGSISLLNSIEVHAYMFWWLLPGPALGFLLFKLHFNLKPSVA